MTWRNGSVAAQQPHCCPRERAAIRWGLLLAALLGCGNSPPTEASGPTVADVAGTYFATTFTTQDSAGRIDQLVRGAFINLALDTAGATTGRLFVPGGAEDGSDFDADLRGAWALHGDTVKFSQPTDTFVRDMAFLYDSDRLSAEDSFGGTLVRVTLTKR